MRKISLIIMLTFLIGLFFFLNGTDRLLQSETIVKFKTEGDLIYRFENSRWVPFELYGVNVNAGEPGVFPGEDFLEKDKYLKWLNDIDSLGMNCIRLLDLMPEDFYDALETFNSSSKSNIYILQGITFDEISLKDGIDPLNTKAKKDYQNKIESVINSVHGNPSSNTNIPFFDSYVIDISDYVIGYCIGPEWQSHDIIYSNIMNDSEIYEGEYFYSSTSASAFESYIAQMLDYLVRFEMEQYSEQKLVSILGSLSIHQKRFAATADERVTLLENNLLSGTKSYVDLEEILPKDNLKSGYFVSYNVYRDESDADDGNSKFENVYEEIQSYHSMPVVITEFGYPSNRLATDYIVGKKGYMSETEQAERIIETLDKIENAKCAGSFIMEWHDSWFKSAWNTKKRKILDSSPYWSDSQTYSQSYGLIGYEPRSDKRIFYPDDSIDEWNINDLISENANSKLSVSSDIKYVYLMLEEENGIRDSKIYIDLDVTSKSGVSSSEELELSFELPVDFIVEISNEGGRLYVHEYYNTQRFEKSLKELKIRPDVVNVTSDMNEFSPIYIDIKPNAYIHSYDNLQEGYAIETGKLYVGNTNPLSTSYVSYADYYVNNKSVEIRIPWALMNFMDPSNKIIHDDYYDKYNIEPLVIDEIRVGATLKRNNEDDIRLKSSSYKWDNWINPDYEMRYKKIYYELKDRFESRGQD